ncbi:MAG: hypothetical protein WEB53_08890 [Akkermansiaceae bacterium]
MKSILPCSLPSRIPPFFSAAMVLALVGFGNVAEAVSIRFLPINGEVSARKFGLQDGKGLTELNDLNPKKRSKAYTCSPGDVPATLVALDRERPGGNPLSVEIVLPAGMESPLVLIFADTEHRSGVRVLVLEDASTRFPWGSLRFVNAAQKPLMIRCDKDTVAIAESPASIDLQPGGEARNIGVQLFSEQEPDAILYSAVWEHDPNLRKLIFILSAGDPASKELNLEIIPQDKRAKD